MIARILRGSFGRQKRRKVVAFTAIALGTAAASALLDVAMGIGDKVNRELRAFGANLVVSPAGSAGTVSLAGHDVTALRAPSYLPEESLRLAKENFWVNNVLALAPQLDVPAHAAGRDVILRGTWFEREMPLSDGSTFTTGIRNVYPFWRVEGAWPGAGVEGGIVEAMVGASLAGALEVAPGATLRLETGGAVTDLRITGVLTSGGDEDRMIVTDLASAQRLSDLPGKVDRILVSALTTPEDAAVTRLGLDPAALSAGEFEKWSCTPFVSSIAYELRTSIPGSEAHPIRRVAGSEGAVLGRISGLMALLAAMAIAAAALTVTSSLTTGVLERRAEIGLLKAMGATDGRVVGLFLLEAAVLGAAGGIVGSALGAGMARWISVVVFGSPVELSPFAFPLAVLAAVGITLLGCALPARRISSFRPYEVLHGL